MPDELRHQLGLDVAVVSVKSTCKKLIGKKGTKKIGYFETIGCKGKRKASVTFTGEDDVQHAGRARRSASADLRMTRGRRRCSRRGARRTARPSRFWRIVTGRMS